MSGRDLDAKVLSADAQLLLEPAAAGEPPSGAAGDGASSLRPLLQSRPAVPVPAALPAVVLGDLLALVDDGRTPLVMHSARPGVALRARSTVDLHAAHIGKPMVLAFEAGDPERPIVMGVLRDGDAAQAGAAVGQVEIDADGERLLVTAKNQMVLRCGKASITLTQAGKVLIDGTYVSSRSSGVNRIKGGSVQLN